MRYEIRPLGLWTDPETPERLGSGTFRASWQSTLDLLGYETEQLDAGLVVMQIDVQEGQLRRDGMLKATAKVGHPGVAVSFESRFGPLRYATDRYEPRWSGDTPGWQANVRAIALALQALRAVDRYGVSKRGEQYRGWAQIESGDPSPARGEALVKRHGGIKPALFATHPDHGGDPKDFADVNAYRVKAAAGA
jgi:hypothetical protein